ncbi:TetR/AcrR family transcriptional regulator [Staphylococcus simulans]|uniref:TetR/AcrR family transcriptional regulator n=2 Tax=Staphylococcus simulans TaxID=1286 RepID=UPI000E699448|nr:TetR/AcrR family transcriptional regulator [Staphylococcus simulans]RIN44257.1 TetR/AcrR family transcriptional regulator [Staphylococcus simulans]
MKNEIVNNAIELFAKKGYYGCTLEEIANSVSIKKASLYYYFASKANIYEACSNRIIQYFNRILDLQENISQRTLENLRQFIIDMVFKPNISYLRMYIQFNQAPDEFKEQLYQGIATLHSKLNRILELYYEVNDISMPIREFKDLMLGIMESGFIRTTFVNYFDELSYRRYTMEKDVEATLNALLELE